MAGHVPSPRERAEELVAGMMSGPLVTAATWPKASWHSSTQDDHDDHPKEVTTTHQHRLPAA
jgi:hypothetical protein